MPLYTGKKLYYCRNYKFLRSDELNYQIIKSTKSFSYQIGIRISDGTNILHEYVIRRNTFLIHIIFEPRRLCSASNYTKKM